MEDQDDRIDYERVIEMIVFCKDWQEKEQILRRAIRRLIEIETIEQIENKLKESEDEKDY